MTFSARMLSSLATLALVVGLTFVGAAPASANVTLLCTGYTGCAQKGMSDGGYGRSSGTMYWRMYAGHNCTNYAAFRMVQSGLPNVRPWEGSGNATYWGTSMASITDGVPTVGSIAWWKAGVYPAGSAGHVAYVEKVISKDEIIVSQDSWGGDFSWARITRDGKGWPSGFIHFNDVALTNVEAPVVSGTARVGSTLTAGAGVWKPGDVTLAYQWRAAGEDIDGANGSSLKLTQALQDKRIRVKVTASKVGYPTESALSTATKAVQPGVITNTVAPTVAGEAQVDSTLTVIADSWTPTPRAVSYQWLVDGTPIEGATGTELAVTPALVGKVLAVAATATKTGYEPVTATSGSTTPVAPGTLTVPAAPTLTGEPRPGEVLTVSVPAATPEATPSVVWLRGNRPIPDATGSTYTLTAEDLGKRISARVEYTRPGYTTVATRSGATAIVRDTPVLRIGTDPARARLLVRAAVRSKELDAVEGLVRIRSRGELLAEVPLVDGLAETTLRELPAGTWTFRFRFPSTRQLESATVTRQVQIG